MYVIVETAVGMRTHSEELLAGCTVMTVRDRTQIAAALSNTLIRVVEPIQGRAMPDGGREEVVTVFECLSEC